jgi:hypothetical protein
METHKKLDAINAKLEVIRLKLAEYGDHVPSAVAAYYIDEITTLKYELDEIPGGERPSFRLVQAIKSLEAAKEKD